jgi:histone deacetylase 1/2
MENLLSTHGTVLRLSCPYTSQQNGKPERAIRTLDDTMCTLMFHAHLFEKFWAEALATVTYLVNQRPCKATNLLVPYTCLHGSSPTYTTLRVFGCLCYPNISSTAQHKLNPCVFLGYPSNHYGYRCYKPVFSKILISHHVIFDETMLPF